MSAVAGLGTSTEEQPVGSTPRGFVIHFTARSGSTFVIFTLKKHPDIVARAEIFGNKQLPGGLEQNADNQVAFLRKYWRPYRKDQPRYDGVARGFKVQILRDSPQIKAPGRFLKVCGEYDIARFFLYRRNHVKQIVSALRARQVKEVSSALSGQETAHVYDDRLASEVRRLPPMHVDPEHLQAMLSTLKHNYRLLDGLRAKCPDAIELVYEDCLQDRQGFFDRMFAAIGVPSIDVRESDETKKITNDDLRGVISNHDELLRFFDGTEYASQLAE